MLFTINNQKIRRFFFLFENTRAIHLFNVVFFYVVDVPRENVTKLSIVGSGLEILEDSSLRDLELSSLNLAKNDLIIITDEAFM